MYGQNVKFLVFPPLVWCILLGNFFFMFSNQNSLVLVTKGLFDQVFTVSKCYQYKIIQMHIGLRPYNVYSISHGSCSNISVLL